MKQAEKTQEDARKCGDMLLIAEAMLDIVNEHNREDVSQLDVRIGAL
jgi:class 3 adenylate cyclase